MLLFIPVDSREKTYINIFQTNACKINIYIFLQLWMFFYHDYNIWFCVTVCYHFEKNSIYLKLSELSQF